LLVDNGDTWVSIETGLLVYVSFAKGCTASDLPAVVRKLLNLPFLTDGHWGDGSKPTSVIAAARRAAAASVDPETAPAEADRASFSTMPKIPAVMIIPSAGLVSKVKGKGLQYRDQCAFSDGRQLYMEFVRLFRVRLEPAPPPPFFSSGLDQWCLLII
jgi:hypothetical protein